MIYQIHLWKKFARGNTQNSADNNGLLITNYKVNEHEFILIQVLGMLLLLDRKNFVGLESLEYTELEDWRLRAPLFPASTRQKARELFPVDNCAARTTLLANCNNVLSVGKVW